MEDGVDVVVEAASPMDVKISLKEAVCAPHAAAAAVFMFRVGMFETTTTFMNASLLQFTANSDCSDFHAIPDALAEGQSGWK